MLRGRSPSAPRRLAKSLCRAARGGASRGRELRAVLLCLGPRPLPLPPSRRASPAPCRSRGEPGAAPPARATAARPRAEPTDTKPERSASRPGLEAPRTHACTAPCPGAGVSSPPRAPPRGFQSRTSETEPGSPPQPLLPAVGVVRQERTPGRLWTRLYCVGSWRKLHRHKLHNRFGQHLRLSSAALEVKSRICTQCPHPPVNASTSFHPPPVRLEGLPPPLPSLHACPGLPFPESAHTPVVWQQVRTYPGT